MGSPVPEPSVGTCAGGQVSDRYVNHCPAGEEDKERPTVPRVCWRRWSKRHRLSKRRGGARARGPGFEAVTRSASASADLVPGSETRSPVEGLCARV